MGQPTDFDVDWVVSTARQRDPSLSQTTAEVLAGAARQLWVDAGDAPSLARALMRSHPDLDVSQINAIAKAAADHVAGC